MSDMSSSEAAHAHLLEHGLSQECLHQGRFLRLMCDAVQLPDGQAATREYVAHTGAVMVIPLFDDGRLLLERQFRYAVGRVLIEFPAGKLDPGEGSLACAQRELQEETGYTAQEWAFACAIHPVGAYSSEHIDIWFARGLNPGKQQLDQGEFLDVFTASLTELQTWVSQGTITDAKTIAGILWVQGVLSNAWPLQWLSADSSSHPVPAGSELPKLR